MFDPTIYENIKVVLEGSLYDLDLKGIIHVTNRQDLVDLSRMSRNFQLEFQLVGEDRTKGEISLKADTYDLAAEILELDGVEDSSTVGCTLHVTFHTFIEDPEECEGIEEKLLQIWSYRPLITQEVSFVYHSGAAGHDDFKDKILLDFHRKINEDNMEDIEEILTHMIRSMKVLGKFSDFPE